MSILLKLKAALLRVLKAIALVIAWVLSILIYVLLIGPYAVLTRLAVGDLLKKKPDPRQPSYWRRHDPARPRPERPF